MIRRASLDVELVSIISNDNSKSLSPRSTSLFSASPNPNTKPAIMKFQAVVLFMAASASALVSYDSSRKKTFCQRLILGTYSLASTTTRSSSRARPSLQMPRTATSISRTAQVRWDAALTARCTGSAQPRYVTPHV
jgi:hypothetical protein